MIFGLLSVKRYIRQSLFSVSLISVILYVIILIANLLVINNILLETGYNCKMPVLGMFFYGLFWGFLLFLVIAIEVIVNYKENKKEINV